MDCGHCTATHGLHLRSVACAFILEVHLRYISAAQDLFGVKGYPPSSLSFFCLFCWWFPFLVQSDMKPSPLPIFFHPQTGHQRKASLSLKRSQTEGQCKFLNFETGLKFQDSSKWEPVSDTARFHLLNRGESVFSQNKPSREPHFHQKAEREGKVMMTILKISSFCLCLVGCGSESTPNVLKGCQLMQLRSRTGRDQAISTDLLFLDDFCRSFLFRSYINQLEICSSYSKGSKEDARFGFRSRPECKRANPHRIKLRVSSGHGSVCQRDSQARFSFSQSTRLPSEHSGLID